MLSAAEPRPWPGMPRDRAKRIRSQLMRKNSLKPVLLMTSSSFCRRAATSEVTGRYFSRTASWHRRYKKEYGVSPAGTGKARTHQVEAEAAALGNFRGLRQSLVDDRTRVPAEDLAELSA